MSKKVTKLEWVIVEMSCDKCKEGVMEAVKDYGYGMDMGGSPAFLHRCNSCGVEEMEDKEYPYKEQRKAQDIPFYEEPM